MGISQVEIANFLGVDQSLISKIEKGERSISSDMLDELSSLFGVSLFDMQKEDIEPVNLFRFPLKWLNTRGHEIYCFDKQNRT